MDVRTDGAVAVTVTYDPVYDVASHSLTLSACSNWQNGLISKGFRTFGFLPHFPNIGGVAAIPGWNSSMCGSCWKLEYNSTAINVIAMDHANDGFNIALKAMNLLTNNQAVFLGRVDTTATEVSKTSAGCRDDAGETVLPGSRRTMGLFMDFVRRHADSSTRTSLALSPETPLSAACII